MTWLGSFMLYQNGVGGLGNSNKDSRSWRGRVEAKGPPGTGLQSPCGLLIPTEHPIGITGITTPGLQVSQTDLKGSSTSQECGLGGHRICLACQAARAASLSHGRPFCSSSALQLTFIIAATYNFAVLKLMGRGTKF